MKRTFIVKTFRARAYRSAWVAGPVKIMIIQPDRAAMFVAGAVAGRHFHTGATAGTSHG